MLVRSRGSTNLVDQATHDQMSPEMIANLATPKAPTAAACPVEMPSSVSGLVGVSVGASSCTDLGHWIMRRVRGAAASAGLVGDGSCAAS